MTYVRDLMRDGEATVIGLLVVGEEVLATGRCADITTTGDLDSAGAGWTYVMVTDRRLFWVPSIRRSVGACQLDLDAISSCKDLHWRHRSALAMRHDPLIRQHFAPNRQRNWEYTSMAMVDGPLSTTILGFSRPTTAAAERLKEQLTARGVQVRPAESPDRLP